MRRNQSQVGYDWKQVTTPRYAIGLLTLSEDGSYSIGPMHFDQESLIEGLRFPDAQIDKPAGVGEILTVVVTGQGTVKAKFNGLSWFIQVRS